ncbi:MAG: hypothetical protein WCB57_04295 [Pseudonocardiaceae bacterium]
MASLFARHSDCPTPQYGPTASNARPTARPRSSLETVPLDYRGERVGELVVGVRSGQRRLSAADRRVLELLAAPLALAVHARSQDRQY